MKRKKLNFLIFDCVKVQTMKEILCCLLACSISLSSPTSNPHPLINQNLRGGKTESQCEIPFLNNDDIGSRYKQQQHYYDSNIPQTMLSNNNGGVESILNFAASNRKMGFLFLSFGGLLTVLGMALFFEKNLIRVGNIFVFLG